MSEDPFLLAGVSGRKPAEPSPIDKKADQEYKRKLNEHEKTSLNADKQAADEAYGHTLYQKICNYHKLFPFLSNDGPKMARIEKMNLPELEREYSRIKKTLNSQSALNAVKKIDMGINFGIEKILIHNEIPADGLAAFTATPEGQEMLDQEYKELAIEYEGWLATSVEARYFWKTISKIMLIIDFNKKNFHQPVNPEQEKEFEDL